ncbi:MAG: DUF808 domain-containing protein [Microbacteriaceae bacterium]|nr:DUF808 domain-containing protein [Microbacteriaceae bacterium]
MASGLAALFDDIAAIAKQAAASIDDVAAAAGRASAKAAGVVVDDAAVAPRFVEGVEPRRELPIIGKIAMGSLFNKVLLILPLIMALSTFLPAALTPLLMLGGAYLVFEGAEKLWEMLRGSHGEHVATHAEHTGHASGHAEQHADSADKHGKLADPGAAIAETSLAHQPATGAARPETAPHDEKQLVRGAIRTDFILSAEIMVIALNEVAQESFWARVAILLAVAVAVTVGVYGVVALLVKMDDIGLALRRRGSGFVAGLGGALVKAMPIVLEIISKVGLFAMLWVGGHILIEGAHTLGWHLPHEIVHGLSHAVPGGLLQWLVETACALVVGIAVGSVIFAIVHNLPFKKAH